MAGDLDAFAVVLVESGGSHLGRAAAEIVAVMGHRGNVTLNQRH